MFIVHCSHGATLIFDDVFRPLIHCYEFRPFQTKLGVDKISQFWPNFTSSAKFHNPGNPEILVYYLYTCVYWNTWS